VPAATTLAHTPSGGDDVSEWAVESLTLHNYSFPICKVILGVGQAHVKTLHPGMFAYNIRTPLLLQTLPLPALSPRTARRALWLDWTRHLRLATPGRSCQVFLPM
jgi:hypothetical protein